GYVGTVFVPVLDENGKSVALVGADISMHEMLKSRQRFVLRTILTSVLTVGALVAIYLLYLQRRLVSPLRNLTASVASYVRAQDKPRYVPADIHTHDEVETLSDAFSQMAEDMREYIDHLRAATAEKQRIQTELDVARDIQLSMLPNVFPPFPECDEFSIYATIDPAKEVGGDFYDFYRLDENRLCFLIADVSGKGVPAALFMMIARALLKNEMQEGGTPAEVMETVNGQLCEGNEQSMFVTALVMVLDTKAHTLRYVNAGHNPPLLRRAGGSFEYMSLRRSPPLAVVPGKKYEGVTIPFASGDTLFLYTDGVTEALNPREELYGEERLRAALNESAGDAEPTGLIGDVTRALAQYVQGATQADDITMLAVKATR
ncbi:MAG: HAMP domain-containing protein, partial [Clostridia bacterium]|nr:HAMP domain-containing protein [Clostridia bacterium]